MKPGKPSPCIQCNVPLTEAKDSREHIIPDAIGGRRIVRDFICKDCNSRTGTDWDAVLSKQMEHMSLLFGVERSRGDLRPSPISTETGDELLYRPDGTMTPRHPSYEETPHDDGVRIEVTARNIREAKAMLKGIARKYPDLDVQAALENVKEERVGLDEPLKFSPPRGGPDFWRSAVKSMLALVRLDGHDPRICDLGHGFLLDQDGEPCIGFYYERDVVRNRRDEIPCHVVHVEAPQGTNLILGYIEYFGFFRAVSLLSSSYGGGPFQVTYAVDPRSGEELDLDVRVQLTETEVVEAYDWKKCDPDDLRNAMEAVIGPAVAAANEVAMSRLIDAAILEAMQACGIEMGADPTDEQYRCFSAEVARLIADELAERGLIR